MGEPEDCNETYFTYRSSGQRAEIAMDGRCPIGPMSGLAGNGPAPSESPPPILRSPQLFLEGTSYGMLPLHMLIQQKLHGFIGSRCRRPPGRVLCALALSVLSALSEHMRAAMPVVYHSSNPREIAATFGPCMHSQCYGAITRSAVPGAREPVVELAELNNKRARR